MKSLSAIIIIMFFSAAVFAQAAGDLDNTFSGDGKVIDWFPVPAFYGYVSAMTIQLDGKILVAGTINCSGAHPWGWYISRYNTDGSLDNSFGSGGSIVDVGETSAVVFSLTVQQDWKIVAVVLNSDYYSTKRYNSDGSFDASFVVNSYFDTFNERSVAVQSDGKIVVGGWLYPYSEFMIVRYNSNGSLDSSFNSSGMVSTSIGLWSGIFSIAIQVDGKILAAGGADTGGSYNAALARYNLDGSLDSSFNQNGIVITPIEGITRILSILLQPDGKILANGDPNYYSDHHLTLIRYNSDGSLDTTFGDNGIVNIYSFKLSSSFALQADGKIVASGATVDYPNSNFGLICLNANGTIDTSFGINGVTVTDFDGNDDAANRVCIEPDRKIVVAGFSDSKIALARYLSALNVGILNFSSPQSSPLIYPNPIHQTETLEYTLTKNESLTIALYDASGTLVQSFITNENRTEGEHKEQLKLNENLASGNYFLTLSNGSHKVSVKLVKQ